MEVRCTLPAIAAHAELGAVNASADLRVLGFTSNKVGRLLPRFESIDVGSYGQYTKASDAIRDLISSDASSITPVVLKTFTTPAATKDRLTQAIGSARAVRYIGRGMPLGEALDGTSVWPEMRGAIESTYAELVPGATNETRPNDEQAEQARQWQAWLDN